MTNGQDGNNNDNNSTGGTITPEQLRLFEQFTKSAKQRLDDQLETNKLLAAEVEMTETLEQLVNLKKLSYCSAKDV